MAKRPKPQDWSFLFENSADGILVMDAAGAIHDANPRACEMLGYGRDELVTLDMAAVIAPEDLERHTRRRLAAMRHEVVREERRMRRRDGTIFSIEGWGRVLNDGRIIGFMRDLEPRRLAQAALSSEALNAAMLDAALDAIVSIDHQGRLIEFNPAAERLFGHRRADVIGHTMAELLIPERLRAAHHRGLEQFLAGGPARVIGHRLELPALRADGVEILIELSICQLGLEGPPRFVGFARDVTERRAAEEALARSENQLRHAQRLESVGRLAGGIAHDFNNLLTVILAYAEQQMTKLAGHPLERSATEIHKAATRAATLTRQLLAFSRRQVLEPRVIDLDAVLADLGPMLKRLIGEDIDLLVHTEGQGCRVRADRLQIEQVVMNLVVNARDAIPHGGRLSIGTHALTLDEGRALRLEGLAPGRYVTLVVSDSGVGMDADVRAKLFEPFFTTKERGVGTGLGLSTAYGIVQQSGGAIEVESEPDQGATFTIYLPQVEEEPTQAATPPRSEEPRGHETVLLVEDEAVVRDLMSEILRGAGFLVLEARDGPSALELADSVADSIHLLVTDVVMPGMSGRELAEKMAGRRPGIGILYVSGYTRDLIARQGILESGVHLLQKPFDPEALIVRVREILDASGRRAA
jgi:PAS domain S-box-containing protein